MVGDQIGSQIVREFPPELGAVGEFAQRVREIGEQIHESVDGAATGAAEMFDGLFEGREQPLVFGRLADREGSRCQRAQCRGHRGTELVRVVDHPGEIRKHLEAQRPS